MTEAVGYISGRWCSVGLSSSRRCWPRGDGCCGAGRAWLVLAFGLWIGSLLSKEIGAIWPLVLLGRPPGDRRRSRAIAPALAKGSRPAAGAHGTCRSRARRGARPGENPGGAEIIWRYGLVEVEVMFRYFSLLLSPADQSIFHQVSEVSWPPAPRMVLALIWLGAWLATAWKLARLDGAVTLGMVWFVLLLVPSSVLVLLNLGEPMAEHRVYLAAAGFFLASGTIVGHVWAFFDTRTPRSRLLLRFSLAAWLAVLAG